MGNSQTKYTEELAGLHNKFFDQFTKIIDYQNGLYDNVLNLDGTAATEFPNIKRFNGVALLASTKSTIMMMKDDISYGDRYQGILNDIVTINDAILSLDAMILFIKQPLLESNVNGITADVSPGGKINDKPFLPNPSLKGKKKHDAYIEDTQRRLDVLTEKVKYFETQANYLETTFKLAFTMDTMGDDSDEDVLVKACAATAPPAYNSVDVKS